MDLIGAAQVGLGSGQVVGLCAEQSEGDVVPVCPVEVAQPDDGTLVGVVDLAQHGLESPVFPALLGVELLDVLLELDLLGCLYGDAVGDAALRPWHT